MLANCTLLYHKGFDVVVAEQALIVTKNQGVQPAMEWYDIYRSTVFVYQLVICEFEQIETNLSSDGMLFVGLNVDI